MVHTILGHFELDIDFWPHFLVFRVWSISPIPQMCLMLDEFLWEHSSRDCDISCSLSLCLLKVTINLVVWQLVPMDSFSWFNNQVNYH